MLVNIMPRETVTPFAEYVRSKISEQATHVSVSNAQDTNPSIFMYDPLRDMGEQLERLKALWEQGQITNDELHTIIKEINRRR